MLNYIDSFLNKITMYRLVLYVLIGLLIIGGVLGVFGLVNVNIFNLAFSTAFILAVCWITNMAFAKVYNVPTNVESVYITALILALIISPLTSIHDTQYFALAAWASVIAIASKYIIAIKRKHIFNPAAFGVAATALFLGLYASWWVGTAWMMPFVLIGGLLITRKILRFDLVLSFFITAFVVIIATHFSGIAAIPDLLYRTIFDSSLLFFAFIMLTEPLTTPPTRPLRVWYGVIVGALFTPAWHIGSVYSIPELDLVIGNIYSYLVSSKAKLMLKLQERKQLSADMYDFIFEKGQKLKFKPGQYLEWTLGSKNSDNRGNRRYFTIASSPTEENIRMGIKFYDPSSTFKKTLLAMKPGDSILAGQLAGDFTLPKEKDKKLVFIAGGIGVTPFRSMIKYLLDTKEKRDIVLIYSARSEQDFVYRDLFDQAQHELGIKVIYKTGILEESVIMTQVPNMKERTFYLSGPRGMVVAFDKTLQKLGVPERQIKKDFFPGFV